MNAVVDENDAFIFFALAGQVKIFVVGHDYQVQWKAGIAGTHGHHFDGGRTFVQHFPPGNGLMVGGRFP